MSELVDVVGRKKNGQGFFNLSPSVTPTIFPLLLSLPALLHWIQCFCAAGQSVVKRQGNKVLLCGAAAAACQIKGATSVVFLAQRCSGSVWWTVNSWGRTARHVGVRLLDCKAQGWHALAGQGEEAKSIRWRVNRGRDVYVCFFCCLYLLLWFLGLLLYISIIQFIGLWAINFLLFNHNPWAVAEALF